MAIYNTVSTYQCYAFQKGDLIKLAESFNTMSKKEKLSYEEFNSYYEKYFATVIKNKLGFDYPKYGYFLLNAKVEFSNEEEKKKFATQKFVLSNFLATYVIEQELHSSINPKEVYSKIK